MTTDDRNGNVAICVRDVWKRYPGTWSLRGVSYSARAGRVMGVLGENGSGKSTMFRIVAGLTRATKGSVEVLGGPPDRKARRRLAYMPEVDPFYAWMTVRGTLDYVRSFYDDWDENRAGELLDTLELSEHTKVDALSRGQRGRLKVAAAFSRRCELVLMDEPLSGIDQPSRIKMLETLFSSHRDPNQTILISTHMVYEVEPFIEDVIFIRDGEITLSGEAAALKAERGKDLGNLFTEVAV